MIAELEGRRAPGTGGFVRGAGSGRRRRRRRSSGRDGSTQGVALAAQLERFRKVPTLGGRVSFSQQLHTVFGRQYRVIRIQNNRGHLVGVVTAKVVPKI